MGGEKLTVLLKLKKATQAGRCRATSFNCFEKLHGWNGVLCLSLYFFALGPCVKGAFHGLSRGGDQLISWVTGFHFSLERLSLVQKGNEEKLKFELVRSSSKAEKCA